MIVVMIIGVVYALVLSNFHTKKKVQIHKLENLKSTLLPLWKRGKRVDFYILDGAKQTAIFINNTYQEELEADIKLSEFDNIIVYKSDHHGESQEMEFMPIMIDKKLHKVTLAFTLFPNGSNSTYIIKKQKRFYLFYPYFKDVIVLDSLDQAVDALEYNQYRNMTIEEVHD